MATVEWFQVKHDDLLTYPQLSGGDIGKFVIKDPSDGHLIIICDTRRSLHENLEIIKSQ